MSISLAITSTATSNDIMHEDASSKVYVDEISIANNIISPFGSYRIDYITVLHNLQGDVEAICISYDPFGYVIVNVNDYSVPEFSPTSIAPYSNSLESKTTNLYNGLLSYYTIDENNICTDLLTKETLPSNDLTFNYHKEINVLKKMKTISKSNSLSKESYNDSYSDDWILDKTIYNPVKWASTYCCGVHGFSMIVKYIHDYHEWYLLDDSTCRNMTLQKYLVDNNYLPDAGVNGSPMVEGSWLPWGYKGVNAFFADHGSNIRAQRTAYSKIDVLATMRTYFLNNMPVLLGTSPQNAEFDYHWLIAYGYSYWNLQGPRIIVNDGWGRDEIYVTIEDEFYEEIVTFG